MIIVSGVIVLFDGKGSNCKFSGQNSAMYFYQCILMSEPIHASGLLSVSPKLLVLIHLSFSSVISSNLIIQNASLS